MEWKDLIPLLHNKPWTYRLKIEEQPLTPEWSRWLISPTHNYLESEYQGPYPTRQIEWIDINPIEIKTTGRLMTESETDHSNEVQQLLKDCSLSVTKVGHIFRIFISVANGYRS